MGKRRSEAVTDTHHIALRASYLVANCIDKVKKPFTIGEELILLTAKDICPKILGEAAVKKIPLSTSH